MGRKILFIAYSYPPVGGLNLPGAQRTIKLVRNLEYEQAHVLTLRPDYYPDYVDLNNNLDLPVSNEFIHRTKVFNVFNIIIKIRNFIFLKNRARNFNPDNNSQNNLTQSPKKVDSIWYRHTERSRWQKIKDFLSNFFNFPDDASPWIIPGCIKGLRIIRKHKITVIFATGMPWSSMCIGWLLSKFTGVPLVVDFRDPWIGNIFHISMGDFYDKLSVKLEQKIVEHAKLIFANTEELRTAFLKRYPYLENNKFVVLPNGYDPLDYTNVQKNPQEENPLLASDKLIIVHAGFLYGARDPSPIIDAILQLPYSECVVFCQIGKISLNYEFCEKYREAINSNKIVLIEQLPFEKCLAIMLQADVLLNIQPKTMTQVPSKLYDYLCLNKPILTIAPVDGALGNLILRHQFGFLFPPENIEGIKLSLQSLYQLKRNSKTKLVANYPDRELYDFRRLAKQVTLLLNSASL